MEIVGLCIVIVVLIAALVSGAFFMSERITEERFERELSDEENKKNKEILQANMAGRDLSDDDISKRLSKLASRGNIIVYPGRGKDKP